MGLFGPVLPPIMVGEADRHALVVLALGGIGHTADQADDLLYELGRAAVVPTTPCRPMWCAWAPKWSRASTAQTSDTSRCHIRTTSDPMASPSSLHPEPCFWASVPVSR